MQGILNSFNLAKSFILVTILLNQYTELIGQCQPHFISTADDEVSIFACANDGKPDNYSFKTNDTTNLKKRFVLANGFDNIIGVQASPFFNFDGATSTFFRVWSIVFSDSISFRIGSDVSTIIPIGGCARLSENVIIVTRDIPTGQDAVFAQNNRDTFICSNNPSLDTIQMAIPGNNTSKHIFIVTDGSGKIKDFFKGPYYSIDFLPKGFYFIYDLAYTGNLSLSPNGDLFNTVLSSGCYSVGVRPARLELNELEKEEMILLSDRRKFCPGDDKPDIFQVNLSSNLRSAVTLVLLDQNGICTQITPGLSIDLNNNPEGTYTLYSIRYSGKLLIKLGDTISSISNGQFSSDCFVWSTNNVSLELVKPNAGTIRTTTNDSTFFACPGDRFPDRVSIQASNHSLKSDYTVFVVNEKGKIVSSHNLNTFIDFEGTPKGSCSIYGVAHTGELILGSDSTILTLNSTDCISVTKQVIRVTKDIAKGGTITLKGGSTELFVCDANLEQKKIEFESKNASKSPYKYVLTTESGIIIDFIEKDSLRFDGSSVSLMRIYGVAYSGTITIQKLNNLFASSFSNGCFSISENFIRIVKTTPFGGGIRLPDGGNKDLFCPSDPGERLVTLRNVASSINPFSFILTDNNNVVIDIFPNFSYRFDSLQVGQYFVYGVSYIGNITLKKKDTLDLTKFSDDCFHFSNTPIEVVINEIKGGLLTTTEGSANVFTCPSNLDADIIDVIVLNARSLGYRFIITNELDIIIGFSSVNAIDFGTNPINSRCRIYGVAYKGAFTGVLGRKVTETAFSNSCYDLTDNFINVRKIVPPAHRLISSVKDSIITLCIGDSQKDTLKFSTSDSLGMKTVYLAVENGKITRIYSNSSIEFEKDAEGLVSIYSLIFTGRLLASPGLNLVNGLALSDDCFSLSSNNLLVDKVKSGGFCVITNTKDEIWVKNLKLYPNPTIAQNEVTVEWTVEPTMAQKLAVIEFLSLDGRSILKQKIRLQISNKHSIQLPSIGNSIYVLKIESEGRLITKRVSILSN